MNLPKALCLSGLVTISCGIFSRAAATSLEERGNIPHTCISPGQKLDLNGYFEATIDGHIRKIEFPTPDEITILGFNPEKKRFSIVLLMPKEGYCPKVSIYRVKNGSINMIRIGINYGSSWANRPRATKIKIKVYR
jgi:hypothetical protein